MEAAIHDFPPVIFIDIDERPADEVVQELRDLRDWFRRPEVPIDEILISLEAKGISA